MNTSEELFNQLRAKFSDLTMADADAQSTSSPEDAQFFTFEYKDHPVSIALGEKELSLYYSRSMTEGQSMSEKTEWYKFIQDTRKFAKQRNLGFDVRDISKSNLEKKDYKYLAQNKIAEARTMYGTTKTSYHPLSTAKVIIKHTKTVDEEQVGSRSRNIKAIFIQNEDGERFKFPIIHLAGARAMARHVANGGLPYDEFGKHIQEQSMNLAKLRGFTRYINRNDLLNTENDQITNVTSQKIENIKSTIHKLTTQRGYTLLKDSWKQTQPVEMSEDEINEYKDKLTKKTFDEAMLDVLPIIHSAIKEAEAEKDIDVETTSAQKNQAYVDAWLSDPNNKLVLRPNEAADKMLSRTKFKDKNIMIASVLRDIATRFVPENDEAMRLNNFAADMDSEIQQQGELFQTPLENYPQLKKTAIMLVKKYLEDLKQIKADESYKDVVRQDPKNFKNIKGKVVKKDMGKYYKKKYKEEDAFKGWANNVTKEYDTKKKTSEGTWAVPDTKDKILDIKDLMKDKLEVGVEGENAQGILYDLIGDDELFDDLYMLAQEKGPEADARPLVKKYMEVFIKNYYDKGAGLAPQAYGSGTPKKGFEPTYDAKEDTVKEANFKFTYKDQFANKVMMKVIRARDENSATTKFQRVKPNAKIVDVEKEKLNIGEQGPQSIHDILQQFPQEVNAFKTDPDFDILDHEEFYEALFNMYWDSGEMPYGTAKARTGDPAQWITDQLHMELTRPERQRKVVTDPETGKPKWEEDTVKEDQVFQVRNIKWDTESATGKGPEGLDLPKSIIVNVPQEYLGDYERTEEFISDFITNYTGFTHKGFDTDPEVMDAMEDFEFRGSSRKRLRKPIKSRHKLKKENDLDRIKELAGVNTDEYSLAQVGKDPIPKYKDDDRKYKIGLGSKKPKNAKEPYLYKKDAPRK
jgi:hypothetical protein